MSASTFADRVLAFFSRLHFEGALPEGIRIMNPYRENPEVLPLMEAFFRRFYSDNNPRIALLGINPGRFGGGVTGISFTDTKRLSQVLGLTLPGVATHEISSVFVYEVIDALGGPEAFYSRFYINSICPLGFTSLRPGGKEVNYNYYDNPALYQAVKPFMVETMGQQIGFGLNREVAFCLGTGKNFDFMRRLNDEHGFFGKIIPLEHPRFVMQYRLKRKPEYVERYVQDLLGAAADG